MSSPLYTVLARAFDAGREAATERAAEPVVDPGGQPRLATTPEVATAAMSAMAHVLHEAGCLREPPPPAEPMSDTDAAKLLCRLSRTRRLDDPDTDHVQLLQVPTMVDYAWDAAVAAGIPPADATAAHEARRLLLARHQRTTT
jgi:hypothetical protein